MDLYQQSCYAKWNKSKTEQQILHDLTCVWNLNKANSQNHRVWVSGTGGNGEGWVKAQRFMWARWVSPGEPLCCVVIGVNSTVLNSWHVPRGQTVCVLTTRISIGMNAKSHLGRDQQQNHSAEPSWKCDAHYCKQIKSFFLVDTFEESFLWLIYRRLFFFSKWKTDLKSKHISYTITGIIIGTCMCPLKQGLLGIFLLGSLSEPADFASTPAQPTESVCCCASSAPSLLSDPQITSAFLWTSLFVFSPYTLASFKIVCSPVLFSFWKFLDLSVSLIYYFNGENQSSLLFL